MHWVYPAVALAKAGLLGRPGSDLLSRVLRRSTIGAEGFHGRVRDGIGCGPLAMATRSSNRTKPRTRGWFVVLCDGECLRECLVRNHERGLPLCVRIGSSRSSD